MSIPACKADITSLVQSGDFSFPWSWQALPAMIIIHLPLENSPRFGGAFAADSVEEALGEVNIYNGDYELG